MNKPTECDSLAEVEGVGLSGAAGLSGAGLSGACAVISPSLDFLGLLRLATYDNSVHINEVN